MKYTGLLATFAATAAAIPQWGSWNGQWGGPKCVVNNATATNFVTQSTIYLMHTDKAAANASGQALFADNIQEYGDSINSLKGDPLGTIVENGKQHYIADTINSPPIPSIDTIAVVYNCDTVVWQWQFNGIGSGKYRVRGFTRAHFNADAQVDYQYVEFNGLAWGLDIGFNITVPPGLFGPPS